MTVTKRLYVISDLHLGGDYADSSDATSRGFRICTHVGELAGFIRSLALSAKEKSSDIELVINGDLVDFLAEKRKVRDPVTGEISHGWQPFIEDPEEAVEIFRRIIARDQTFFRSLKELLAAGAKLTVTLGNHDIEMSFPALRRVLAEELDVDGKRFSFIFDGEAYQVGKVLIEHGNRYDPWNVVTYDSLRRARSVQSRLEPLLDVERRFEAPAGSCLVAAIMNEIKKLYPFIDLLKPENAAAIPILIALAPEYRTRLAIIAQLFKRSRAHVVGPNGLPSNAGDISETDQNESPGEAAIRDILSSKLGTSRLAAFNAFTIQAGSEVAYDPTQGDISGVDFRSAWSMLKLAVARSSSPVTDRLPALLAALEGTRNDFSFDRQRENPEYSSAAQRLLSRGFQVVTFGHTHLAKAIKFRSGTYINTGTWADLLPFPSTILDAPSAAPGAREGDTTAIERLRRFVHDMATAKLGNYIKFIPTYACIELDEGGNVLDARLSEYDGDTVS